MNNSIPGYYTNARTDLLPLLPERVSDVLEIGCGSGNTLAWLKDVKACRWTGGVEIYSDAANEARQKIDALYEGDIENLELPIAASTLDLVLCLDVLEHLVDPWKVVKRLTGLLKPGGKLIASIPNIRNRRVIVPLVMRGQWQYTEEGILDKTHLRFFTRDSAMELIESGGLRVDLVHEIGLGRSRRSIAFNSILPLAVRSFFVRQYIIRGAKQ